MQADLRELGGVVQGEAAPEYPHGAASLFSRLRGLDRQDEAQDPEFTLEFLAEWQKLIT